MSAPWWWSSGMQVGLSAQAIAGVGRDHPYDPGDLLRCINYCRGRYNTADLRKRMAGRSPEWDRLTANWDELTALLQHEMDIRTDDRAPNTYMAMKRILADGITCATCNGSGRGAECEKCKGTGRRCGGRCRAEGCYDGAEPCRSCRGAGFTKERVA